MNTEVGAADIVTAKSACAPFSIKTEDVDALFVGTGSAVVAVVSAEFKITVPDAVPATTFTIIVNVTVVALLRFAESEQRICPVGQIAGLLQVHPAAGLTATAWNAVLGGGR